MLPTQLPRTPPDTAIRETIADARARGCGGRPQKRFAPSYLSSPLYQPIPIVAEAVSAGATRDPVRA